MSAIGMVLAGVVLPMAFIVLLLYACERDGEIDKWLNSRPVLSPLPPPRPDLDSQLGGYSGPRPTCGASDIVNITYTFAMRE